MTFAYSLVVLSALLLLALLVLAKGHWFARQRMAPGVSELQPIDIEAFRNLIDENEEAFLRENLPPPEFRKLHRERMLSAVEYVRAAYENAGILVRIADSARESSDYQVAQAAAKLSDNANRLRWHAAKVVPRLYFKAVFPGANNAPRLLFERYDMIARQAIVLGRLGSAGRA